MSITSRNKIYGSRSEKTGLVRTLKFECMNVLQNVILLKKNGKCADQAGWKKAHSGQYLCCSHATSSFLLMTKILCVAGRRVPLDN